MKLYKIETELQSIYYIVANNIEKAILKFRELSNLQITNICYVSREIYIGDTNE